MTPQERVREAFRKASEKMDPEMPIERLEEIARARRDYEQISQTLAPQLADALDAAEKENAELKQQMQACCSLLAAPESSTLHQAIMTLLLERDRLAEMKRPWVAAYEGIKQFNQMRADKDAAEAKLEAARDLLSAIQKDYDHPWPNEDEATTFHRQKFLVSINAQIATLKQP